MRVLSIATLFITLLLACANAISSHHGSRMFGQKKHVLEAKPLAANSDDHESRKVLADMEAAGKRKTPPFNDSKPKVINNEKPQTGEHVSTSSQKAPIETTFSSKYPTSRYSLPPINDYPGALNQQPRQYGNQRMEKKWPGREAHRKSLSRDASKDSGNAHRKSLSRDASKDSGNAHEWSRTPSGKIECDAVLKRNLSRDARDARNARDARDARRHARKWTYKKGPGGKWEMVLE